jgi:Response regulators consisting of a CheY-like receiver domain and a winged-helix DNA-binding domain
MSQKVLLVAEDDENDALLLERALRRADSTFRMVRVVNGEELIGYLEKRAPYQDRSVHPDPDLVLLDLKMPRVDGFDVLQWRRDSAGARLLPFIVFSSSDLERDIRKAYSLGANSYVVKPMRSDALDGLVQALLAWWGRFNVGGRAAA